MNDYSNLKAAAEAATPQDFDSAEEATHDGWIECPHCGGEGSVEIGGDYLNYDSEALGVQFYGIGDAHVNAEAYYRAANPATILALLSEIEDLRKDKDRLNALDANGWDIRNSSSPMADTGDYNQAIEIVGRWMDKPHERVIGEDYNENLRAAIDQAMKAPAYPPERPEYDF